MKESNTITLKDGRKLGYAWYGDAKGKPLFFFHGWPGCRFRGRELDSVAKKLHIFIISPDRPGFGLSDFMKHRRLLDWPEDVEQLAAKFKLKKFAVVGVSGGGPYVASCAYKIPERITKAGIVVGLGPVHIKNAFTGVTWYGRLGWENYKYPFVRKLSAFISFMESRCVPTVFMNVTYGAKEDKKLLSAMYRKDMMLTFKEAYRQGMKGPEWDLHIYSNKWGFSVSKIKTHMHLWYGKSDKNVSLNMGKYYAAHIKKSRLTIYPNEGHMVFHNHTEEILKQFS